MIRMSTWVMLLVPALAVMAGCAGTASRPRVTGLPRVQADEMSAQHSRFDGVRDAKPNARTHFAAGRLAESQGGHQQAIVQYNHAVQIDPGHLPSLYRLGLLYTQLEAYSEAISAWTKYLDGTDGDATAWSNLAYCYEVAGQLARAEEAYRKGLERDPENAPCRVNYGLMLARMGREKDAVRQWQVVLSPAQIHYNLASIFEQQGRKEEARAQYWLALDWDRDFVEARQRLAAME